MRLRIPDLGPARRCNGRQRAGRGRIDEKSFRCITQMTAVRRFYMDTLRGDLAATVAAANSPTGAKYPPGSVIQLVPGEAMVKPW
jgi:hypothetical protein